MITSNTSLMRIILFMVVLAAAPTVFFGQKLQQPQLGITLDSLSKITHNIDSLKRLFKKTFTLDAKDTNSKSHVENWQFTYSPAKRLAFFQVSRHENSSYYEEDYYLGDSGLIYTSEKNIRYMPHRMGNKESSHWIEECYFLKGRLIHETSHGHGITETDDYDPEQAVLKRFSKRFKTLMVQIKQLDKNTPAWPKN